MTHDEPFVAEKNTLYVVATPIGNRRDITLRALDILRSADLIAAEDTRVSGPLLRHYGASAQLLSLHQHNERKRSDEIISLLAAGKSIALVTDAGSPGISDPGAELVSAVRGAGYRVVPLPGPSALTAALSAAGLGTPRFVFCGFLTGNAKARSADLNALAALPFAAVFYEAPHRIEQMIAELLAAYGPERDIVIARELTKMFESIHRCPLGNAGAYLTADANRRRGEFVLIVEGSTRNAERYGDAEITRLLSALLEAVPLAQAARLAATLTGESRKRLYERALTMQQHSDSTQARPNERDKLAESDVEAGE